MKIKNLSIIILMTTFFIILGTRVFATTGTINSETVRLRKEPNTTSTILEQLDQGDEVEILEQEDGWYKVKAKTEQGKVTGYISEKLIDVEGEITPENKEKNNTEIKETTIEEPVEKTEEPIAEEPQETIPTVSTNIEIENVEENEQYNIETEVSIKILPLINSREKAKISGNIKIVETINDWSRIENDTEIGWIRTNILKTSLTKIQEPVQEEQPAEEQPEPEQPETEEVPEQTTQPESADTNAEINKTGYVSAEGLRVRKGPSTDTEEITSLSKNDQVEIIGQEGNWYKIKLDGEIGYISAKYISDTKLPETTSRSGSTLKDENETKTEEKTQEKEEKTAESTSTVSGTTGAAVVEYAKQYLGYKYVSGGASPSAGFDCSGFTTYVYKHFGITLNRSSSAQINNGVAVEKSDLQLGDIVLFNNDANTKIGHVGIYVGNGNFIHASNPSDGVKITTLESGYYAKRYVGARRVI